MQRLEKLSKENNSLFSIWISPRGTIIQGQLKDNPLGDWEIDIKKDTLNEAVEAVIEKIKELREQENKK